MKKEELIQKAYEIAVERYAAVGVDTEKVLKTMQDFHLSLHCWQADDVAGFEVQAGSLTGGIQATGNYPGKARNIDELRADILKAALYSGYSSSELTRDLWRFSGDGGRP